MGIRKELEALSSKLKCNGFIDEPLHNRINCVIETVNLKSHNTIPFTSRPLDFTIVGPPAYSNPSLEDFWKSVDDVIAKILQDSVINDLDRMDIHKIIIHQEVNMKAIVDRKNDDNSEIKNDIIVQYILWE